MTSTSKARKTSNATSASRNMPASSRLKMRNAKGSSRRNLPETDQSAHDERLSLPATRAEPFPRPGCQDVPRRYPGLSRALRLAAIAARPRIAVSDETANFTLSGRHQRGRAERLSLPATEAEPLHQQVAQVRSPISRFMARAAALLPPLPDFFSSRFFTKPPTPPRRLRPHWPRNPDGQALKRHSLPRSQFVTSKGSAHLPQ